MLAITVMMAWWCLCSDVAKWAAAIVGDGYDCDVTGIGGGVHCNFGSGVGGDDAPHISGARGSDFAVGVVRVMMVVLVVMLLVLLVGDDRGRTNEGCRGGSSEVAR